MRLTHFIAGAFEPGTSAYDDVAVRNPADGEVVAHAPMADAGQLARALDSAAAAFDAWSRLPGAARGRRLQALADALLARQTPIAQALAREGGKSLQDAMDEVAWSAELTRYHAEWGRRIEGEIIPSDNEGETLLLQRVPLGVVACFIPFNYPVYTLLRKIAPALVAGNTVVVRPSNLTPSSAAEIARAVVQAGLPAGVVQVLTMRNEEAEQLCTDPRVRMLTLTGSLDAGRALMGHARRHMARLSLELGGKTPVVIAPDADVRKAVAGIVASKTTHCGQVCTAAERVYACAPVHDAVLAGLRNAMRARTFGDRAADPARMGPLASAAARERVHALVQRAVAQGAVLECGGVVPDGPGHFYPPTLLSGVTQDMDIVQHESFGPVLALLRCATLDDGLALANDHPDGLTAVLWAERHRDVMRFANRIEAGELYVNRMPADPYQGFHAGWKRSGLGGDDGKHGVLGYTQTRLVVLPG